MVFEAEHPHFQIPLVNLSRQRNWSPKTSLNTQDQTHCHSYLYG